MQISSWRRWAAAAVAATLMFGLGGAAKATDDGAGAGTVTAGQKYMLHLHHLHTGETLDVVYRIGDTYIPGAIAKLNYFLRDHRTNDVSHYDVKEFDLLHSVMGKLGKPDGVIDIVCGYRTPWSNNFLRTRSASTGVAKNSQHMQAKAIDIRVPGVATSDAAGYRAVAARRRRGVLPGVAVRACGRWAGTAVDVCGCRGLAPPPP